MFTTRKVARLERELAVLRERDAILSGRVAELLLQHSELTRRYNRLVEQRLYRQGDINQPLSDPPKAPPSPLQAVFGSIGMSVMPTQVKEPAGVSE